LRKGKRKIKGNLTPELSRAEARLSSMLLGAVMCHCPGAWRQQTQVVWPEWQKTSGV